MAAAEAFAKAIDEVKSEAELAAAIAEMSERMGFRYFALTHHVDIRRAPRPAIRLHNYPAAWVDYFDEYKLGPSDPVHRASHVTSCGFTWSEVPGMIRITTGDRDILERAQGEGIGDGFTVPAHVPGEANGSCSFATGRGEPVPAHQLMLAQLVGGFAFEGARRLWRMRDLVRAPRAALTDRQRDCVFWVARGKSNWEISRILNVSPETVADHLKLARERYGVCKRALLAVHAIYDGSFSFVDVLKP